jgi:catechol 2,3-dioxygenase-like lactoylglutathione lyase family enzyme
MEAHLARQRALFEDRDEPPVVHVLLDESVVRRQVGAERSAVASEDLPSGDVMGLRRIRHVKVPVTNLRRSVGWYQRLLDLEPVAEFVEQGELRGIALVDKSGAYGIALRDREYCASRPDLAGFDVFALEADDLETLHQLARHCDKLGISHSGVHDRGAYGANLDIPDPDGTVLRFLANNPLNPGTFHGVEFAADGTPEIYHTRRFP